MNHILEVKSSNYAIRYGCLQRIDLSMQLFKTASYIHLDTNLSRMAFSILTTGYSTMRQAKKERV